MWSIEMVKKRVNNLNKISTTTKKKKFYQHPLTPQHNFLFSKMKFFSINFVINLIAQVWTNRSNTTNVNVT